MPKLFKSVLSLLIVFSVPSSAEIIEKVIATVNGELILKSDLDELKKQLNKAPLLDDLALNGKNIDEVKKDEQNQLSILINQKLIESEIKKLNLSVTQERVDQEISNLAKANNLSKEELLTEVKKQGVTISDYQSFVKNNVERQSLIEQEITSKIIVTDEDVLASYLAQNPSKNNVIAEYKIAHILFLDKKDPEGAKKRAQNVFQLLKSGESFEKLAGQYSEDPDFSEGGILGTFKSGDFLKEMENEVAKIKINETTNVIKTKMGLHILKLLNKKIVSDPQFEKIKEQMRGQLKEVAFKKQFSIWLENKKEEAYIKLNK